MIEFESIPEGCTCIWEVWVNSDTIEGRGDNTLHARFSNRDDAVKEAEGKGPMGQSDAEVRQAFVFGSLVAFAEKKEADLRARALGKLSYEEKKVLNLI